MKNRVISLLLTLAMLFTDVFAFGAVAEGDTAEPEVVQVYAETEPAEIKTVEAAPTPAPVVEEKAEATPAPVVEEKAEATPAPVAEEKAEATPAPVAEEKAEATTAPVAEEEPEATPAPAVEEEPEATPVPVAEEEPEATPAPAVVEEPVATTAPEAVEEIKVETPEDKTDYTRSCAYSPDFVKGYVKTGSGAKLYASEDETENYATLSRGIAYAVKRVNAGRRGDRMRIAFGIDGELVYAWADAQELTPVKEYTPDDREEVCLVNDEYPVPMLVITPVETKEETAEETETPEIIEETEIKPEETVKPENKTEETAVSLPDIDEESAAMVLMLYNAPASAFAAAYGNADHVGFVNAPAKVGKGDKVQLKAAIYDENGNVVSGTVKFGTVLTDVASITEDGLLTAHAIGNVRVTAILGNGMNAKITVQVVEEPSAIKLSRGTMMLSENGTGSLSYTVTGGAVGSVSWLSSDESVATVSADGVVTGKKAGTAVITAVTYNGMEDECAVTVMARPTDINLTSESLTVKEGMSADLGAYFTGDVTGYTEFEVVAGDAEITIVRKDDNNIAVNGVLSGTATIKATVAEAAAGAVVEPVYCEVTVVPAVKTVEFRNITAKVGLGETVNLQPVALDARGNVIDAPITLTTSNKTYITIKSGSVYGAKIGSAKIKAASGSVYAQVSISVVKAPTSIKLSAGSLSLSENQTARLTYTLSSGSASAIKWTSSNPAVATVDDKGNVTAVAPGTATITALTYKSTVKAACMVKVYAAPTAIVMGSDTYTVVEGEAVQAACAFEPAGAFSAVTWSLEENEGNATVDAATGRITGVLAGSCIIKATAHNYVTGEDVTAAADVVVTPKAAKIVLGTSRVIIGVGEILNLEPKAVDRFGNEVSTKITVSSASTAYVGVSGTSVKGVKIGSSKVTVKAANGVSTIVTIKVVKAPDKVVLGASKLTVGVGETAKLTYKIANGGANAVTWESSDTAVATVENGVITATGTGTAKIYCRTYKPAVYAECTVTVMEAPMDVVFVEDSYTVKEGGTVQVNACLEPETAYGKISYSIEYDGEYELARISGNTVTGVRSGKATLVATAHSYVTGEDITARCPIEITTAPVKVGFESKRTSIGLKETVNLRPVAWDGWGNAIPDAEFTLVSSAPKYVSVNGLNVTGLVLGSSKITVRSGNASAAVTLKVVAAPTSVTVSKTALKLGQNCTEQLSAWTVKGQEAQITWSVIDGADVAEVSCEGLVTALKPGTAKVQAMSYNGKKAVCTVTVYEAPVSIAFKDEECTVKEGKTYAPALIFNPVGSMGEVEYSVSFADSEFDIAAVNAANGVVTGLASGKAVLTAKTKNANGEELTATMQVNVVPDAVRLELPDFRTSIGVGEIVTVNPVAYDARGNVIETAFTVATSNKNYVYVSGSSIKGMATGKANVTVKTANGLSKVVAVSVLKAPTSIKIDKTDYVLQKGSTGKLKAIFPAGMTGAVKWMSTDESVVTVDAEGNVTAVSEGDAIVRVSTYRSGVTYSCNVAVKASPTAIGFDAEDMRIEAGASGALTAKILSANTYADISYESDNAQAVTVNAATGAVKAVGEGSAVITAKAYSYAADAWLTDTVNVVVCKAADSIDLGVQAPITLGVGESITLKPVAYDADGNAVITGWALKTSSATYAAVSGTRITGKKAGSAIITVSTTAGKQATVRVNVLAAPTSVAISKKALTLAVGQESALTATLPAKQAGAVSWTTSNKNVVAVDSDGALLAIGAGTATVTAKTYNGKAAACTVTVKPNADSIAFGKDSYSVPENGTVQTSIVFTQTGSWSEVSYEFIPDEDAEATVSASGLVKGLLSGTGILKATGYNYETGAELTAECVIEVIPAPVTMELRETRTIFGVKETVDLRPVAYDARGNAVETAFTATSSAAKYLKVASGAKVQGVAAGTAKITVKTANGLSVTKTYKVVATPKKVTISATSATLSVYGAVKLFAAANNATTSPITWTSSNPAVATVSDTGLVAAVSEGSAVITAKSYSGVYASCTVKVLPEATSVEFAEDCMRIGAGDKATVSAKLPDGTMSEIVYASSNPFIATVDKTTGSISALRTGSAVITATVHNRQLDTYYTAELTVDVVPAPAKIVFKNTRTGIGVGENMALDAIVIDSDGNESVATIKYTSSATYVAVNSNGVITGKKAGTAIITAKTYNGITLAVKVVCTAAPTGVKLSKTAASISETGSVKLTATLVGGANSALTWTSSNLAVAEVDENGTVSATGLGTAVITCTTYNGMSASCTVTVLAEPDGIAFTEKAVKAGEGSKVTVKAVLNEGHIGEIRYSSSDETVAKVDELTGVVTAVSAGSAVITATTVNGKTGMVYTNTIDVTVTPAPASVKIVAERSTLGVGEYLTVSAVAYDKDGNETPSSFTFTSANTNYLRVSGGRLYGVATNSSITLTATAYNGVKATKAFKIVAAPTAVKLSASTVDVVIGGDTAKLVATLTATSAVSSIKWESENEDIFTVDGDGVITGVGYGSARVKATTYNGKYATATVRVFTMPESIELSSNEAVLGVGQNCTLKYTLNETAGGKVTYTSDNEAVATVSSAGVVSAVGVGTAVITAATVNNLTAKCTVTVKAAPSSIALSVSSITIGLNEEYDISNLVILPEDSHTTLSMTSSSTTVLSRVDDTTIKAKAKGSCTVTVKTHNGKSAQLKVTVQAAPSTYTISATPAAIYIGDKVKFKAVYPSGSAGTVVFESSNPEVISVNPDGTAEALKLGKATITGKSYNGIVKTIDVEVLKHVESVILNVGDLRLTHYDTYTLNVTVLPEDASDKTVIWQSSDPEKVSVDSDGVITALNVTDKNVVISCRSVDGGFMSVCNVQVTPVRLQGFTLSETSVTLERGREKQIEATFTPANADEKGLNWVSSNPAAIKVDENGLITAVADKGSATITCTSVDGGFVKTVSVTATKVHLNSMELDKASIEINHYDTADIEAILEPADADLTVSKWTSSNSNVVTVDDNGHIEAIGFGSATITYTATDAFGKSFTGTAEVVANPIAVKGFSLDSHVLNMRVNEEKTLGLVFTPDNADDKSVRTQNSVAGIVGVTPAGNALKVTSGANVGTTVLTVKTVDGSFTDTCEISVLGALKVTAVPNFAKTTVGNTIVWKLETENVVGNLSYDITVEGNGSTQKTTAYNAEKGIEFANAAVGEYTVRVTVTDADGAVASCENIVQVSEYLQATVDGIVYSYRIGTTRDGVTGAGIKLVSAPSATNTITVPAEIDGIPVIRIDTEAFMNRTSLVTVKIPSSATEIGARAFKGCTALTTLTSY